MRARKLRVGAGACACARGLATGDGVGGWVWRGMCVCGGVGWDCSPLGVVLCVDVVLCVCLASLGKWCQAMPSGVCGGVSHDVVVFWGVSKRVQKKVKKSENR